MLRKLVLTFAQFIFACIISMILFPPEKVLPLLTVAATWFLAGYFTRSFWAKDDSSPARSLNEKSPAQP